MIQQLICADPPPVVRLLTPKTTSTAKSKGCAFLEFTHRNALQQALKKHQTELDGRKINVELTAGGGGKNEARLQKVKAKNRSLMDQRVGNLCTSPIVFNVVCDPQKQRLQTKSADGQVASEEQVVAPQRHSSTSGIDKQATKDRTWSVPDADDGLTHRGGTKHGGKSRTKRQKEWGTGVNAIPVG